ncbi:Gem (Nuclear organelle) associated protein 6 [Nesidiocoris tenuis]|uniref:Gem (Nuclear organelle) associated protein 6 n=1 Tax=Nesidiocoris tenuis TaxID=355587 RepID=A0ABN7BG41_9HEMI|nr:Gem (Nuclear organelle) associated protein 6 [Nesidiocoris tenuis]
MIPSGKDINRCLNIDIVELRDYVDKYVRVSIKGGKTFEGVLYTVDPVSGCAVLFNKVQNSFEFVFGHAVDKIDVLSQTEEKLSLFEPSPYSQSIQSSHDNQQTNSLSKLKSWLLRNRIPVEQVGNELKLGDVLTIIPPYNSNCCLSTNEIVLANVQRLIKSMPSD